MALTLSKSKAFLRQSLKLILRAIASASTAVLFVFYFVLVGLGNIQLLVLDLLNTADEVLGDVLDFESVEIGWHDNLPQLKVRGLELRTDTDLVKGQFAADLIDVRLGQPLWNRNGIQFDYLGIAFPKITGKINLTSASKRSQDQLNLENYWPASAILSTIRNFRQMEILYGHYELDLVGDLVDKKAKGDFEVNGGRHEDVHQLDGRISADWFSKSSLEFGIDIRTSPAGFPAADIHLDLKSLDLVWASLFLPASAYKLDFDINKLSASVDSIIEARWQNNRLDSADWTAILTDSNLNSSDDSTGSTSFKIAGNWKSLPFGKSNLQAEFELESLNAVTLLANYPVFFTHKFYAFMSTRLQSLSIPIVTGRIEFDPKKLVEDRIYDSLQMQGIYDDLTFKFHERWPPLENGQGTFTGTNERIDVDSEIVFFYGIPVEESFAYIEDLLHPDPILTIATSAPGPGSVVLDLFGPDGRVMPGRIDNISDVEGNVSVALDIRVPLRRGVEFQFDGSVAAENLTLMTTFDVEVSKVEGKLNFNRAKQVSGAFKGQALGSEINTDFQGEESNGALTVNGSASGTSQASNMSELLGHKIASQLEGDFSWTATYTFTPDRSYISASTSLVGLKSSLPSPFLKPTGSQLPLSILIDTKDKKDRTVNLKLEPFVDVRLQSIRELNSWKIDKGAISIGLADLPELPPAGVNIYMNSPVIDLFAWTNLIDNQAENENIVGDASENKEPIFWDQLMHVEVDTDLLLLSKQREINDVSVRIERQEKQWHMQLQSQQFVGVVNYKNAEFMAEGEHHSLEGDFSKCHMPEAKSSIGGKPISPIGFPKLTFRCEDTRYGRYQLGKSLIVGEPEQDKWAIKEINFKTPHTEVTATGEWLHSQKTNLEYEFKTSNFGETMKSWGFDVTLSDGEITSVGTLNWNDALTNWSAEKTSGAVDILGSNLALQTDIDTTGLQLINLINYESIFDRLSNDVSGLDKGGITFDHLSGKAQIENGIIKIPGIVLDSSFVEILATGSTNWVTKELKMEAGVNPKVGDTISKSALLINPLLAINLYVTNELLKALDLDLFSRRYTIGGTWSAPEMVLKKKAESQLNNDTQNK